jgi:hypothetical protein
MALTSALALIVSRYSVSVFCFDNAIKLIPASNKIRIRSSAKFVVKVTNILVSKKEENTAKTGMENLKSYQKYKTASRTPKKVKTTPANFQE